MAYISILLPVYNGASLVSQAIDSVLRQPFSDWELIIMNDGSTDETEAICNEYAAKDKRIQVYSH